jgi:hypothetical protein
MQRLEQLIHQAVVKHLRLRGADGVVFFHVPNGAHFGGRRGRVQGGIAKSLGVRAGVSDIIALHRGKLHALEIKGPGGKPTPAQISFIHDVREQGGLGAIANGIDEALHTLENWGLLKDTAA